MGFQRAIVLWRGVQGASSPRSTKQSIRNYKKQNYMSKKTEYNLVIPFSDGFSEIWDLWKGYKWASHKFKYKSVFSEQAALEQLVTLSKGDEETAVKIIKQSMRREWQGLFPLHETTTGNGKSTTKKPAEPTQSLREQAAAEFMRRNGETGQSADGTHLKAV